MFPAHPDLEDRRWLILQLDSPLAARSTMNAPVFPSHLARGSRSKLPRTSLGLILLLAFALFEGCEKDRPSSVPTANGKSLVVEHPLPFVDEARELGIDFTHFNGMSGELYYSEMMGSGVALFDYDNDGDLDVYLVQGRFLGPGEDLAAATIQPRPNMLPLYDRLYRNDLGTRDASGQPRQHFVDVTEESGLRATGYGMGVVTADFDNDGWIDLYVTQAGPNQLWRNEGPEATGGRITFRDISNAIPGDDSGWSLSATSVDIDLDGWLDLFVVDYVHFTVAGHRECRMLAGQPDYCGPTAYEPLEDRLLHNLGTDGSGLKFVDITSSAGISPARGAGMGVIAGDFDGNLRPDLLVSNDGMANFLWMQQADGRFRDDGLVSGTAFNREGQPEAGMGVAAGDYDNDGDEDLIIAHLALETHTLYQNDGAGAFEDVTIAAGLGSTSFAATGFGTAWIDYDNDGWLDLMVVNGAVVLIPELLAAGDPHPLGMPNQLFRNLGSDENGLVSFEEVHATGDSFQLPAASRGLAIGDLDNDGDTDAVVTNNGGAAQVLLNRVGQEHHWLGLRLVAGDPPHDVSGAAAEVVRSGHSPLWRRVRTDGSYLSSHDPRLLFGLGDDAELRTVTVRWPDGMKEQFDVSPDRYTTLVRTTGRATLK